MDNPNFGNTPHGIWSNSHRLVVANLSIRDFYQHGIIFNPGAQQPYICKTYISNTGKQNLKASSPKGLTQGVNNGIIEKSQFGYSVAPSMINHGGGTGYTNGVDVHTGANWIIRDNLFKNFHNPDNADHLWAPAVLFWNSSRNTTVINNRFINVDRAIALGLTQRTTGSDHYGGTVSGNFIYYPPDFYSPSRKSQSDAAIIIWDSPNTTVSDNTIITNGNLNKSIEFRFNTEGSTAINNRVDAPISGRENAPFSADNNRSMTDLNFNEETFERSTAH
ncbi:MAG: hypothetical protein WCY88_10880 [Spongiibacteraceae bacterium]